MAVLPRLIISSRVDYTDLAVPTYLSSLIPASGTRIIDTFSRSMRLGPGGTSGRTITLSGGACTMSAPITPIAGVAEISWTTSRVITSAETISANAYAQPGNGLESVQGVDLANFTGQQAVVTNSSSAGGGADPGWQDFNTGVAGASAGSAGFYDSQAFTLAVSGYATMFRVWSTNNSFGQLSNLKGGLYNSSNVRIASAPEFPSSGIGPEYLYFILTEHPAVTSGQSYRPAWMPSNNSQSWGCDLGATGTSAEYQAETYGSFPVANRTSGTPWTTTAYRVSIYVAAAP